MFLNVVTRVFQQIAVLHAAGTNRFARAAAEAEINMAHRRVAQRQPPILHGAHQVNAPRGESFSLPVSRYVGHEPRQSPQ
jgi:hypothetical protein